jgi:hypothetical protein
VPASGVLPPATDADADLDDDYLDDFNEGVDV